MFFLLVTPINIVCICVGGCVVDEVGTTFPDIYNVNVFHAYAMVRVRVMGRFSFVLTSLCLYE